MKLSEILTNRIFNFPLDASRYFPATLHEIFKSYNELLDNVDDEYTDIIKANREIIKRTCDDLLATTDAIFKGNTSHAYEIFALTIMRLEPFLLYPDKNFVMANPTSLFKARRNTNTQLTLNDMFHVPFEKRYDVSTSRFSLPGVPCLYLGNSVYTCWEELDRPAFAQMPVSRFELSGKNFKFLDLTNQRDFIKYSISKLSLSANQEIKKEPLSEMDAVTTNLVKDHVLPRYLNTYPLLAACYIKVFHGMAHFKPEYAFPQMIMQWIMTQDDIDGIKYQSTKSQVPTDEFYSFIQNFVNYALPIQSYREIGYCDKMTKNVSLTKPLTYELFGIENPKKSMTPVDLKKDILNKYFPPDIYQLQLSDSMNPYMESAFGILEYQLMQMPVCSLSVQN